MDILESGIVPTFIGNPAGIMKRETYGQPMEPAMSYMLAKEGIYTGEYGHDEYNMDYLHKTAES